MSHDESLQRTPLFDTHVALGARMAPFSGWEMPIQYSSILEEARAVRSGAGVFDVSHMGRVEITGPGAAAFLDRLLSFDAPGLRLGRARYGVICNEEGGIIDDCITYLRAPERFLLIPNAGNMAEVLQWLKRWAPSDGEVSIEDVTSTFAMIAHQGPQAEESLDEIIDLDLARLRPFRAAETTVLGADSFVARTGYTGEDGFEIVTPSERATKLWDRLIEGGAAPCGLGARDVLRLEAGLLLHGNDMDASSNPEEAGLGRFVDPDRDGYLPGPALRKIRADGPGRTLVGFTMVGRGIARHGYPINDGATRIGEVTSGSYSPTLDSNIGLGYVPTGHSAPGTRFQVDVRGRSVEAEVTTLPFYSRRRT